MLPLWLALLGALTRAPRRRPAAAMAEGAPSDNSGFFVGVTQDALPFVGNVIRAAFYFSRGWVDDLGRGGAPVRVWAHR